MKVELHECHWRVDTIIIWIVISEFPYPSKVSLVEMSFEIRQTVLEDVFRVQFVEGSEQVENVFLLL